MYDVKDLQINYFALRKQASLAKVILERRGIIRLVECAFLLENLAKRKKSILMSLEA